MVQTGPCTGRAFYRCILTVRTLSRFQSRAKYVHNREDAGRIEQEEESYCCCYKVIRKTDLSAVDVFRNTDPVKLQTFAFATRVLKKTGLEGFFFRLRLPIEV